MLYFYYGDNSYFLVKKRLEAKKKNANLGASVVVFDEDREINQVTINRALFSAGLFGGKSVAIFTDVLQSRQKFVFGKDNALLKDIVERTKGTEIDAYFFETSPIKKSPLYKLLLKKADKAEEYKKVTGKEFEKQLQKEAADLEIRIDPKSVETVAFLTGYDFWQSVSEIKKADMLAEGKGVEEGDLKKLVQAKAVNDIFKTIDALARKDKRSALMLLRKHIESGDNPFYILSMIIYQFRNIIKVKSSLESGMHAQEAAQKLKIHPYVARKCESFGRETSTERLIALYKKIADIDYSTKTGAMSIETALDLFIAFS